MIDKTELLTYLLYFASILVCVVKVGLLVRVRTALFELPPAQRELVTILADNNLGWCLVMVIVGGTIVARVLGVGNNTGARFLILGFLLVSSTYGLVRLGNWFLYPERSAGDRGRSASLLTEEQEITRLRILLERRERRERARPGPGEGVYGPLDRAYTDKRDEGAGQ